MSEPAGGEPSVPVRDILGLPVHAFDTDGFCEWLAEAAAHPRRALRVGYINASTVELASRSRAFLDRLVGFDCLVADGQSIVWASRYLRQPLPERVNVTDVVAQVLAHACEHGVEIALVGGRPGEAERFAAAMARSCPNLSVVLTASGYLDPDEERRVKAEIAELDPGLVLMGMGAPLQEERAWQWANEDRPRVWWCVGAVFEYFAGTRRRAPVWVRRAGLEWIVRLVQEPRRLLGRYLLGNPRFVARVLGRRRLRPEPLPGSPR